MGALRRPQPREDEREELRSPATTPELPPSSYPRWIVISGVIIYCSVFWAIIWVAATAGIDWVRQAAAGGP